jgi:hypothetical protein
MSLPLKERQLLEAQLKRERTQKPVAGETVASIREQEPAVQNESQAVRIIQASISQRAVQAEQPIKPNLLQILRDPNRTTKPQ